jgi:hypothetical protein
MTTKYRHLHFCDQSQYTELQRGLIYVIRRVNGVDTPLTIPQRQYTEWLGCFSAI